MCIAVVGALGGCSDSEPDTSAWETFGGPPLSFSNAGATTLGDDIVAIGFDLTAPDLIARLGAYQVLDGGIHWEPIEEMDGMEVRSGSAVIGTPDGSSVVVLVSARDCSLVDPPAPTDSAGFTLSPDGTVEALPEPPFPAWCAPVGAILDGDLYLWDMNIAEQPGVRLPAGTDEWVPVAGVPIVPGAGTDGGSQVITPPVVAGGVIWMVGARTDKSILFRYDTESDTWEEVGEVPLPSGRQHAQLIPTPTQLLVWNGQSVVGLDVDEFTWGEPSASPLDPRAEAAVVAVGDDLVVWGGRGDEPFDDGARWDSETGEWTELPASPLSPRSQLAAAPYGDGIWLFGGYLGDGDDAREDDGARLSMDAVEG